MWKFAKVAMLSVVAVATAAAEGQGANPIQACTLLTNADIEKVTGRKMYTEATPMWAGSLCGFDSAQLIILSGEDSEKRWENTVKSFGQQNAERFPVPELGEGAYAFYSKPKSEYEDTNAFVVVKLGQQIFAVSVAAEKGKPAQSVQPQAVELAKMVAAKLR